MAVLRRLQWLLGCLTLVGLVSAACAPAVQPTVTSVPPTPTVRAVATAPAVASPTVSAPVPASPTRVAPTPTTTLPTPTPETEKPKYGGILRFANVKDPRHYDIQQLASINDITTTGAGFAGFVQYDPLDPNLDTARIIPEMAEKWEVSKDGTIYTFYLRKNIKFHDGVGFTAQDAVWNINRMKSPPKGVTAPRAADYELVDKIEALDDYTFRITLKKASNGFFAQFAKGWTVPVARHLIEKDPNAAQKALVGTGAFKLVEHQSGNFLKFQKNKDYWDSTKPYLDGLTIYIVPDEAAMAAAFKTHRIDLTGRLFSDLAASDAKVVKRDYPNLVVHESPNLFFPVLTFNARTSSVFSNAKVRRAVFLAIDRQAAIDTIGQGYGELGSFVQPGPWSYTAAELLTIPGFRKDKTADLAEAKRLLTEAGYPNGFKIPTVACGDVNEAICVFTAQQLKKIGIDMGIDVIDYAVGSQDVAAGKFDISPGSNAYQTSDPYELGRKHLSNADNNNGLVNDPVFDDLFFKQDSTVDPVERKKLVRQMDLRLMENAAKVVYFWEVGHVGAWPQVRGFIPGGNYNNVRYAYVWLSQ